jgi:DNA-directed RNA polymerase subunit N (RpoN/RPB10)
MSCGKPIGQLWAPFVEKTKDRTEKIKETFVELGVDRYCCQQNFLGHVELIEETAQLKKA